MAKHTISQTDAFRATEFQRQRGCSDLAARGYSCEHFGKVASPDFLACAKRKPRGVSDVRWRIELRRRAQARELGHVYMDFLENGGK